MKHNLLQPDSVKKFCFSNHIPGCNPCYSVNCFTISNADNGGIALGTYTYTYSIAYYFVVFAMLGINKHGQRIIAQKKK